MRYFISFVLLFSTLLASSQSETIEKYDYFSWNSLTEENVHYYHFQTVIRAYQSKNSPYTKWEIIKQTDSTFLYLEYQDSARSPSVIGNLLLIDSTRIDTFHTFDPETFEEQHLPIDIIQHYFIKHRSWVVHTDSIYSYHYYNYGKKDGAASVSDYQEAGRSYLKLVYRNDSLIRQKELNFALNHNKDTIIHYLIGDWYFNPYKNKCEFYKDQKIYLPFTFHKNGTFNFQRKNRHTGIIKTAPNTHFWYINDDYHLVLEFPDRISEFKIVDAYADFHVFCKFIQEITK